MTRHATCLIAGIILVVPVVARSQEPAPVPAAQATTHPDSTPQAAVARGRTAAEQPGMGGRFFGGFAGGFLGGLIGTGIVYAIASSSEATPPADQQALLATANPTYRQMFETGYREKIRSRRKSSALAGGLLGTAVVVTILLSAQSN